MSLVPLFFQDLLGDYERERLPMRLLGQHFGREMHRDQLSNMTSTLNFPFFKSGRYYRPRKAGVINRRNSGMSNLKFDDKQVQVMLDVRQFAPEEITVKTSEAALTIEGKHEEKQDEHGFISRQFKRRYAVPKGVDIEQIASSLSSDGILTVSMPKRETQITDERSIPIIQTGIPAVKAAEAEKNDESS